MTPENHHNIDPEVQAELADIKRMLKEIMDHFGIGTKVVRMADIRERARKDATRARERHGRKNPA